MMNIKNIFASAVFVVLSTSASALPQYTGNTVSGDLSGSISTAGYYLWQDAVTDNAWHLRWSGIGADHDPVAWAGAIQFQLNESLHISTFLFETGGVYGDTLYTTYDSPLIASQDAFSWNKSTTGNVQGIDFTLANNMTLSTLNLGSSLFADLNIVNDDPGVASTALYIGADLMGTNVLVSERNGMNFQVFEIVSSVPEPASLALLSLGLTCLGCFRRRNGPPQNRHPQ